MHMRRFITFLIILAALGAGYYYRADLKQWYSGVSEKITDKITAGVTKLQEIEQEIFAPPPLRGPTDEQVSSQLTVGGVIVETNRQRSVNGGLPALTVNVQLVAAAQAKANDLFTRQYFEHESPTGEGPGDLAANAGYAYLVVGENLALGNYKDDAALVQAWMDSPGHRANILNAKYTEIGVAVARGMYEGSSVWMAVQEFGRPLSDCPVVSESLNSQISANNKVLDDMLVELDRQQAEIQATRPKRGTAYNQKVDEYNALVEQYNELLNKTKVFITTYNTQVEAFNTCIE